MLPLLHLVLCCFRLLLPVQCQQPPEDQKLARFSVTGTGQEIADVFIGAVWSRMAEAEFVGGMADVYVNKQNIHPVVNTTYGPIKGVVSLTTRDSKPYAAFMGIPFAKPPLGTLRFKAPVESEPWQGTWDGTYERTTCLTFREPTKGKEDCLYLNVFSPHPDPAAADVRNTSPVMVFIYGGAFMGGSSNASGYAPDFLIDKGVLVVTFNYRIGPLGFLSLQNEEVPGNAGLKDQVMALKWVRRNIKFFGGDGNKVTIFGESAGAASVNYHILSPLSAGLFDQAIMESGSSLATWAYTDPQTSLEKAFILGRTIGCVVPSAMNQVHELYECLRETPGPLLVRSQPTSLSLQEMLSMRPLAFVPTVEPNFPGAMVPDSPLNILSRGAFNKVPIVMGVNTAEGLLLYPISKKLSLLGPGTIMTLLGQDLTRLLPRDLNKTASSEQRTEINKRMHTFYANDAAYGPVSTISTLQFLQIISDTQFLIPMLRMARFLVEHSQSPLYVYQFSYDGPYTCFKTDDEMKKLNGTSHMDELGYIFNLGPIKKNYNHTDRNKPEEIVLDAMTQLWTNFANSGVPEKEQIWPRFSELHTGYCDIGPTLHSQQSIQNETVTFWNDIYKLVTGERRLPQ